MSIFDKYDLVDVDETVKQVDLPEKGLIVIVGSSGSGKTTLMKSWGMSDTVYDMDTPIIDLFSSHDDGEHYLILAGLRSVPSWKRTLSTVSNGERHRAEIALHLSQHSEFIDEFTSVVDRHTARALCHSINRAECERLVLSTCHRDVLEWLDFDHAYDTDSGQWLDRRSVRRDRAIELSIRPCDTEAVWEFFKRHHYLSGKVNKSANCWVALYEGKPVAMTSAIAFPSGNWKDGWRGHRTVVLPEFQGLGIGSALSDAVAEHIISTGARFFSKTSHPAFGEHRNRSPKWKPTSKNGIRRNDYSSKRKTKEAGHKAQHINRICFSHEYVGTPDTVVTKRSKYKVNFFDEEYS